MRQLRPYLWIGPAIFPADLARVRRAGITAVLSLQEPGIDLLPSALEQMRRACEPEIAFHSLGVRDYDPAAVIQALPQALATLQSLIAADRVVYLHCSEGINRSPSVALAYLVRHENLPLALAVEELSRCHPAARPYQSLLTWLQSAAGDDK